MMSRIIPLSRLILLALALGPTSAAQLNARAWRGAEGAVPANYPWPELELSDLVDTTSASAICFSGGGSRAYTAALGQVGTNDDTNGVPRACVSRWYKARRLRTCVWTRRLRLERVFG